jgi:transmembrane sensor
LLTRPLTVADNDTAAMPVRRARRGWAGVAGLALVLSATAVTTLMLSRADRPAASSRYAVETTGQTKRTVYLADGSKIDLNRDTRLLLDRADPRFAMLDHGQAYFTIRHDPSAPFKVDIGGVKLEDVGTAFDVIHERGRLDVAVAEGGVIFQPDRGSSLSLRVSMRRVPFATCSVPSSSVGFGRQSWPFRKSVNGSSVFSDTQRSSLRDAVTSTLLESETLT